MAKKRDTKPKKAKRSTRKGNTKGTGQNQKFTPQEREKIYAQVESLHLRGHSQTSIAQRIGVSQTQVSYYLKKLKERYLTAEEMDKKLKVAITEAQYLEVMSTAWDLLEKSGEPQIKEVEEVVEDMLQTDQGEDVDETIVKRKKIFSKMTKVASNEYLTTVLKCIDGIKALRGLDAPKSVNIDAPMFPFDKLFQEIPDTVPDVAEQEIEKLRQQAPQDPDNASA